MSADNGKRATHSDITEMVSLKHWGQQPDNDAVRAMPRNVVVDCGWGRLLFGQTFEDSESLAEALKAEEPGRRDVAFYVREPHVVLNHAPQALFLDPSNTYRLALDPGQAPPEEPPGLRIRDAVPDDEPAVNRIYLARGMVPPGDRFWADLSAHPALRLLVAVDSTSDAVAGVVMGVDHVLAFDDSDNGSSLWALAVDPQARLPQIGEALVLHLASGYRRAGRSFMDLSVMYDNEHAITLYRKLGFEQVPVYSLKKKNPINEKLFTAPAPEPEQQLNIYARLIVDEARRRGIWVDIEDAEGGLFRLSHGARSICCRESLSDLTSAVAMSRCDDKALTRRLLAHAELNVPEQIALDPAGDEAAETAQAFLAQHGRVVVKPARGEQGRGVFVDLRDVPSMDEAIGRAREICETVLLERFVKGEDLRVIVIGGAVVAAAVRHPASVLGNGEQTIAELIEKQSRRRAAATGGESHIPMDRETERCVAGAGHAMDDVLPKGEMLAVRKTANLHTGGTIHDVTAELHPALAEASVRAASALEIPVVGLDLMVPRVDGPDYVIIEANERPGLANHEPQPTAERFVDLLFPQTGLER